MCYGNLKSATKEKHVLKKNQQVLAQVRLALFQVGRVLGCDLRWYRTDY